jgi:hypothetical protein
MTTNGNIFDVFVRDLQTGTTTLVSVNRLARGLAIEVQRAFSHHRGRTVRGVLQQLQAI